ncbi:MAG: hypothetical protein ACREX9_07835 [Gammaproteobacteria bacterium]
MTSREVGAANHLGRWPCGLTFYKAPTVGKSSDLHHTLASRHLFDPKTSEWRSLRMNVRSSSGASPGKVQAHMLDYHPVNNVFVFIASGPQGERTWAYRYRSLT